VDLAGRKIQLTLPGRTLEAPLEGAPKAITHVGYYVMNGVTDFGPVTVAGQ